MHLTLAFGLFKISRTDRVTNIEVLKRFGHDRKLMTIVKVRRTPCYWATYFAMTSLTSNHAKKNRKENSIEKKILTEEYQIVKSQC